MPLNSIPPTTTRDNLYCKRKAAKGQCWVDVAFWGGLVPGNKGELRGMVQDGAKGFKGFLIESGVDVCHFLFLYEVCMLLNATRNFLV